MTWTTMHAAEPPKAILVDLDDTIVDDTGGVEPCWTITCQEVAENVEVEATTLNATILQVEEWYWSDPQRHLLGRLDMRSASRQVVDIALARLGVERRGLAREIANRFRDLREAKLTLLPGAAEALECLQKEMGIVLALVTNGSSRSQRVKLERFDLAKYFEYICIEGEFGRGKPDVRVYLSALRALNCSANEAWMVGDNLEWDVAAPKKIGLTGIWLDRLRTGIPPNVQTQPDRVIASLRELI